MRRQTLLQIWVASGVLINMYAVGMTVAFLSILLPDVMSKDSPIKVDLETGSWLASVLGIAFIPGYPMTAMLMDWQGRRLPHLLLAALAIIGWLFNYFAQNFTSLLIGRILGGFTFGGSFTLGAMVITEYTSPKLRGFFLLFKTAAACLGKLSVHALGFSFHWRTIASVALVTQTVPFFMTLTWPESPAWLLYKNKYEMSERSFFRLRDRSEESENEFKSMIRAQKSRQAPNKSLVGKLYDFFQKFFQKEFLKPFAICAVANAMVECTGRHFFPSYAIQLIDAVTGEKTATTYVVLGIDLVTALGAATSAVLASRVKRRTLLLSSGFSAVLVLAVFCTHQVLVTHQVLPVNAWLPGTLLFIYFILVNLGAGPMPIAFVGELFPLSHRGVGPGLSGIIISFYVMITLKFVPIMLDTINVHGVFAVFGGGLTVSLIILYFILPETKDKTLQEIEDYFTGGRLNNEEEHTRDIIRSA